MTFFPPCLIALGRTSSTMLNSNCESRYPSLCFSGLRGKAFSLSPLSMIFSCRFFTNNFIMLRKFSSILSFLSIFIMKGYWVFKMSYLHKSWWVSGFFPFILLMGRITLINFLMLNHPCIAEVNSICSWWVNLLICYWI